MSEADRDGDRVLVAYDSKFGSTGEMAEIIGEAQSGRVPSSKPRPYRERVGWIGKQRETLRGENPVRTGVSRVSLGQREGSFRAHNPKVAGASRSLCSRCSLPTSWGSSRETGIPLPFDSRR